MGGLIFLSRLPGTRASLYHGLHPWQVPLTEVWGSASTGALPIASWLGRAWAEGVQRLMEGHVLAMGTP